MTTPPNPRHSLVGASTEQADGAASAAAMARGAQAVDSDLDASAARLVRALERSNGLMRHWHLCRLFYAGEFLDLGSRRLHAAADALQGKSAVVELLRDTLRMLAELDAIARLGVDGAARSTDPRMRSTTAALFGQPRDVLREGVEVCLRLHFDGGSCTCPSLRRH